MDVNDRIKQHLEEFPVLLYMKGSPDFPQCGFSAKAVAILKALETRFAYVNILEEPELREGLKVFSDWPTFPQLYVGGELVGGSDIAMELYESGELKTMIDSLNAEAAGQA